MGEVVRWPRRIAMKGFLVVLFSIVLIGLLFMALIWFLEGVDTFLWG